jgi:hypothetical protein
MKQPDNTSVMRSAELDPLYNAGPFSALARTLGLTGPEAVSEITRNPLHYTPTESRSARNAERVIRQIQRNQKPKNDIIGTPRRM